jgi:hypothetical protein
MANLTKTPKQIAPLAGSRVVTHTLGGAADVGDSVYIAADGDVEVSNGSAAATAEAIGLIVGIEGSVPYDTALVAGQRVTVCVFGPVGGFSGLTPGANGWVSDDAGELEDAEGTVTFPMGYAQSTTVFFVQPGRAAPTSS